MGKKPFYHAGRARAVLLALLAFSAILPSNMDVWVDNTSPQGAANKGSSKSHAMTWAATDIRVLGSRGVQTSSAYVRSAENPTDGISRGRVFTLQTWRRGATGSGAVLWLEGDQSLSLMLYINMHLRSVKLSVCSKPRCFSYFYFYYIFFFLLCFVFIK
ncbi:putative target of rapamycin (TOR) kinase 1 [Trypanosoma cruzi]|uniref:Putative target of rapamycin (TOR) kinase 1 n=1 Tax=Trypanosoma cruzi TaxID=5693 RepID=A0A2V2WG60_TRYCR|nr:putative target of rapamycin (TOR) kinase 1 [Trypanosoma cruzi]